MFRRKLIEFTVEKKFANELKTTKRTKIRKNKNG